MSAGVGRPSVTLKLATSLDGRIATSTGQSHWITGPEARAEVHRLRAAHGAVMTGIGTVLADNPEMTARCAPLPDRQPLRVVMDTRGRTPSDSKLAATLAQGAVVVCAGPEANGKALAASGFTVLNVDLDPSGHVDFEAAVLALSKACGLRSVMVEAGAGLASAALRSGLVDRIEWFRAPVMIGGDGLAVFDALGVVQLAEARRWRRLDVRPVGADLWERYGLESD